MVNQTDPAFPRVQAGMRATVQVRQERRILSLGKRAPTPEPQRVRHNYPRWGEVVLGAEKGIWRHSGGGGEWQTEPKPECGGQGGACGLQVGREAAGLGLW